MQKWEYKVVGGWIKEAELNQLGDDGWELVIVDGRTLVFKRLKSFISD